MNARTKVPAPVNEPVLEYRPGSAERRALQQRLSKLKGEKADIPLYIGGKEIRTGKRGDCRAPHDKSQLLGRFHQGGAKETRQAIAAAVKAQKDWAATPFEARAAIFLKAAELLANDFRWTLNAASMLCQSKSVHQAEIDAACEMIDFLRFNVRFAEQIYETQPLSSRGVWNMLEQRPLEGFVFAVTPFNFTSIAGNLPSAPALMGNTVVWKPAHATAYTAHYLMKLFKAAGLPDGVINLVLGDSREIGGAALESPELAGVHFTGSTGVFNWMWKTVGANIDKFKTYPRLVGETGGKDFVMVHASADVDAVAAALARGAFEYQGQKCSAASRAYIPDSLWPKIKTRLYDQVSSMKMGSPEDFSNFVNAVIDEKAFQGIKGYIERAKKTHGSKIRLGGRCDDSVGYFIEPTIIESSDPKSEAMCQEIFGPVLTIHVYPEKKFPQTLKVADAGTAYALTGSIFANDRAAVLEAQKALVNAAGNFYVNDKPTGAVVGQQPFGGARASGTNDKAGSHLNLLRWVSPRTIKETFDPPRDYRYPFLQSEGDQAEPGFLAVTGDGHKTARRHGKASEPAKA